jgi:hypothetical protein
MTGCRKMTAYLIAAFSSATLLVAAVWMTIMDRPGELGAIASLLGELGANILEVDHRRLFLDVPAKGANLDVTVETTRRGQSWGSINQSVRLWAWPGAALGIARSLSTIPRSLPTVSLSP